MNRLRRKHDKQQGYPACHHPFQLHCLHIHVSLDIGLLAIFPPSQKTTIFPFIFFL
jgi:hypothetical protein